ncbi:MAG: glutaredoxin domain-containing protein [Candidatus Omnitrophota bacterium]
MAKEVKLYSIPTCDICNQARAYLKNKGIEYQDLDISSNNSALQELKQITNRTQIPTIIIDDTHVLVGFDSKQLDFLLSI